MQIFFIVFKEFIKKIELYTELEELSSLMLSIQQIDLVLD